MTISVKAASLNLKQHLVMIDGFSTRDGRNKDTQSSEVELTHMSDERPNTDSPGRGGGVSMGPKTRSQEVTERR